MLRFDNKKSCQLDSKGIKYLLVVSPGRQRSFPISRSPVVLLPLTPEPQCGSRSLSKEIQVHPRLSINYVNEISDGPHACRTLDFEEAIMNAFTARAKAKILVDGGDPEETVRVKHIVGYVDGQTTNPSLIAKNPEVRTLVSSGQKFSSRQELDEYKKIVQTISPLVGDAGVSIEVFADFDTTAQEMLAQGREMFSWIPNAYVKYPCTHEGLRAAQMSVGDDMRVNMTLCFSQEQAAAVYAATKMSKAPVYVSPFVGRLDDRGENGMDLVRNIKQMYKTGD